MGTLCRRRAHHDSDCRRHTREDISCGQADSIGGVSANGNRFQLVDRDGACETGYDEVLETAEATGSGLPARHLVFGPALRLHWKRMHEFLEPFAKFSDHEGLLQKLQMAFRRLRTHRRFA